MNIRSQIKVVTVGLSLLGASSVVQAAGIDVPISTNISVANWLLFDPTDPNKTSTFEEYKVGVDDISDPDTIQMNRNGGDLKTGDKRFKGAATLEGKSLNSGVEMALAEFSWDMIANADPFIDAVLTIKNLTSSDQSFSLTFNLPVTPTFPIGEETGFVDLTVTDEGGPGAPFTPNSVATLSNILWTGTINSSALEYPLVSGDINCSGTSNCSQTLNTTGLPEIYTSTVAGDVSQIGINFDFTLSAGDKVELVSRYEVNPVPLPAAVWLFGAALIGLLGISKRQ